VVFYHHKAPGSAGRLAQQLCNVGRVMKNVDQQAHVEGSIGKRKVTAVKPAARDVAGGARGNFHTFDRQSGPTLLEKSSDGTVTATDVEHACTIGDAWSKSCGQSMGATPKHQGVMTSRNPGEWPRLVRRGQNLLRGTQKSMGNCVANRSVQSLSQANKVVGARGSNASVAGRARTLSRESDCICDK
jgi:hypothetical protein